MAAPADRQTLLSYLDDYVLHKNDKMFVQRQGLRLVGSSYRELVNVARRIARELEVRGVNPGDRVLLCGANSSEWIAAFWGCLLRGAVVAPLDQQSTIEFVLSVQKQTAAKLAFVDSDIKIFQQVAVPVLAVESLPAITAGHSDGPYQAVEISRDTLAEIVFTSGTTSTPKGVMLTHGNLLANLLPIEKEILKYQKWRRLVHPLRFLVLVPLSHVFGQLMAIFVPQLLGGEVHFDDTLNPAEIVRRIRQQRISIVVLVPRMLESLRDWLLRNSEAQDLEKSIRKATGQKFLRRWWKFRRVHREFGWKFWAFLSGGATLDNETEEFWHKLGFAVLQGYGMTETAALVSVTHPFRGRRGSIGKPLPGYELKLDESGEIVVRGPGVSSGYWLTRNGSERVNNWLRTGDVGTFDAQGNLYFKGREKDVIVTAAGLNVYPED
ncbi:MAG TPA: long-chain fatty acid--CoA ligase, partial [Pyrinomonadaceae bacterium]